MKDSFENKKPQESDYNAFVSANIANTLVALTKSDVNNGTAVVAPYRITSGTLPNISVNLSGQNLVSDLIVGNLTIDENTTIGELSTALIENNNGITQGMQLSIIVNLQLATTNSNVPYIVARAYEMLIEPDNGAELTTVIPDGILTAVTTTERVLAISTDDLGVGAGTFILSHTIGGKTYVSTQSLVMFGVNSIYTSFTSAGKWIQAIQSYGLGTEPFLSSNSANGATGVAVSLTLLAVETMGGVHTAGSTLASAFEIGEDVKFDFNRAIPADITPTAYMMYGNSPTQIPLTFDALSDNRRKVLYVAGEGNNPELGQYITFVIIVDGEEYSIRLRNFSPSGGGDSVED